MHYNSSNSVSLKKADFSHFAQTGTEIQVYNKQVFKFRFVTRFLWRVSFIYLSFSQCVQLKIRLHCSSQGCTSISLAVTCSMELSMRGVSISDSRRSQCFGSVDHISPTGRALLSEDQCGTLSRMYAVQLLLQMFPAFSGSPQRVLR